MITIAPIAKAAPDAVEALLDEAFGADRHGRTAYKLRAGVDAIPALSFAAFEGDALVGTLQSWPIELADMAGGAEPLVLVGPVAVRPDRQRDGIGKRLMQVMLAAADESDAPPLMLIGDPEYYDRLFGFTALATGGWSIPGPVERHRLLARIAPGRRLPRVGALGPRRAVAPALR